MSVSSMILFDHRSFKVEHVLDMSSHLIEVIFYLLHLFISFPFEVRGHHQVLLAFYHHVLGMTHCLHWYFHVEQKSSLLCAFR